MAKKAKVDAAELPAAETTATMPTKVAKAKVSTKSEESNDRKPAKGKRKPARPKSMSALAATARVLSEEGKAMTCAELIGVMAAKGYWCSPKGKTPASTLYAAITREIALRGEASRFRKSGPGRFEARTT